MKILFEHAYEGLCNSLSDFIEFAVILGKCGLVVLVYITIPLWVIPYAIYKNKKGGEG